MKITVVGTGYVGLSMAVLLAQKHDVTALDIAPKRIKDINERRSPVFDLDIQRFFKTKKLSLRATLDQDVAYVGAEYIIIALPTNYNEETNSFDTGTIDGVLEEAFRKNTDATVIIKSTIPIGYTRSLQLRYGADRVAFSPEFLREGNALHDNLYPSRIVIGGRTERSMQFAEILLQCSSNPATPVIYTGPDEAEAIKLFANTYLAMRVAYFNELDNYALANKLNAGEIIEGIGLDPRIGSTYNNPSFGFGGYCLPKDTKQLRSSFGSNPSTLIGAITTSNADRARFIAHDIAAKKPDCVGIYKLAMKSGADNYRASSALTVANLLQELGVQIVLYEPLIVESRFSGLVVENDLNAFKRAATLIICNRMEMALSDVADRVYTRDLFGEN
ncbi:nucleotide sugar dehydrogenase [Devosia sp. XGJD_8]|uniref:nucleotide sugar dehydrogenase n=1 Tax=Devosia sp. XGJD_8 TaxID=3391187 RepID=UPI003984F622